MTKPKSLDFNDCKAFGKKGEADIQQWLINLDGISDVIDHREDPHYQQLDIDFTVIIDSGQNVTVEVKSDRNYETNNAFLEIVSNEKYNAPGCMIKTKSDFVFYYFPDTRQLFVYPTNALQYWIYNNKNKYKLRRTSVKGNKDSYSLGITPSLETLLTEVEDSRWHLLQ